MKRSIPSNIVYGELGITPFKVDISTHIVSFWSKLVNIMKKKEKKNNLFSFVSHILFCCITLERSNHNGLKIQKTKYANLDSLVSARTRL